MDHEQTTNVSDAEGEASSPAEDASIPADQQAEHDEPLQYEHTWDGANHREAASSPAPVSSEATQEAAAGESDQAAPSRSQPPDTETGGSPASPPPSPPQPAATKRKKRRWPRVLLIVALVVLLLSGSAAAYGYYYYETFIQKPISTMIHPVSKGRDEPQLDRPIPTDSSVSGRVWNILLLGSDNDQKFNFPAVLTQVVMIVHIDTIHDTVTMLSIPRDSWIYVPEVGGMYKIDQVFLLGAQQHNSFDDGVRLMRLTIEKDYGIPIDRYAWVGLNGFVKVIDTLGGVDVNVQHPIVDDAYPKDTGNSNNPYNIQRLYIPPGPQHLDGEEALEYVRSRHADLVGDIGRTQRQQQVLAALKQKLNPDTILTDIPQLLSDMSGYLYTDISEQELLGYAVFGRTFSIDQIQHITLGPGPGSQDYGDEATVAGQDVILPNCQNIQPVINRLFGLGNVQSCNVNG